MVRDRAAELERLEGLLGHRFADQGLLERALRHGSAPRAVKAAGGRVWSPFYKNLTPETLAEARQLGLLVSVWTPDSPDDLKKMIEMKVDAITTNRPDVLKRLLADK